MACARPCLLVVIIACATTACSDSAGRDPGDPGGVGAASQPFCLGHTISNVVVAPGTYHWEDLPHLLNSAEGFGSRTLGLTVSSSVTSSSTSSTSYTSTDSEISSAVGYDVEKSFSIDAFTTILVPFAGYARLEAYATYAMTTWDILGTACTQPGVVVLGTGVSYKPVGTGSVVGAGGSGSGVAAGAGGAGGQGGSV